MVERPTRRFGTGCVTLPEVRNWLGDPSGGPEVVRGPPGGPKVVGRPSRRSKSGRRLSRRSRTGQETLPEVWK